MARGSKSKAIARRGLMLVLSSPSGAGKTTLSRMLLTVERGLELSISVTTRPKRRGEVNGRHYHFIDRKKFDQLVRDGDLLEYAEVFGNGYGTPRKPVEKALKQGGSEAFLTELRRAPVAGRFEVGSQTFAIRWARQRDTEKGRVISVVTDKPVYFVGAGVTGAKSKEGFDVAVIQLTMDSSGVGEGTMTAAAKVKPGGPTGVEVETYENAPLKLSSVMRLIK